MEAFLAAYLTLFDPSSAEEHFAMHGYHHVPASAAATDSRCSTAWGAEYTVGQSLSIGGIQFQCLNMSTWVDGEYVGTSTRWNLSGTP